MLATLTGMKIVMMRKWNPDEGSILPLIVLLNPYTFVGARYNNNPHFHWRFLIFCLD